MEFILILIKKGEIMVNIEEFPIVSTNELPGYEIVEVKGFVYGLTVRSRSIGGQLGAMLSSIKGGEITQYVTMMEDSRNEATSRCIQHAKEIGANAIIAARMDSDSISEEMQEVLTYGTGVIVRKL